MTFLRRSCLTMVQTSPGIQHEHVLIAVLRLRSRPVCECGVICAGNSSAAHCKLLNLRPVIRGEDHPLQNRLGCPALFAVRHCRDLQHLTPSRLSCAVNSDHFSRCTAACVDRSLQKRKWVYCCTQVAAAVCISRTVIDLCRENRIPVFEKSFSLTDVYGADEAFVTGTFAGLPGSQDWKLRTSSGVVRVVSSCRISISSFSKPSAPGDDSGPAAASSGAGR